MKKGNEDFELSALWLLADGCSMNVCMWLEMCTGGVGNQRINLEYQAHQGYQHQHIAQLNIPARSTQPSAIASVNWRFHRLHGSEGSKP